MGNQPEIKFRAGAISATVWQNPAVKKTGEATSYRTISLERGYKDKTGQWKSTSSFRINDLPRAAVVLNRAYEWIVTNKHDADSAEADAAVEDIY